MNCPQCGKRMKGDWPDKSRWFNCANCRDRFFLEDDGELVNVLFRSRKNERTGSSFHQYLISLRLKQAEWLLTSGELPISEISAESGFSSDKTFYRTFREHYGKTPGEYRKEQQKR